MFGSSSTISTFLVIGCLRAARSGVRPRVGSCPGSGRQRKRKTRATAKIALHPHPAAEVLDDLAADVQAKTAAVRLVGECIAHLVEFAEDGLVVFRTDAPAVVAHVDPQGAVPLGQRDL